MFQLNLNQIINTIEAILWDMIGILAVIICCTVAAYITVNLSVLLLTGWDIKQWREYRRLKRAKKVNATRNSTTKR